MDTLIGFIEAFSFYAASLFDVKSGTIFFGIWNAFSTRYGKFWGHNKPKSECEICRLEGIKASKPCSTNIFRYIWYGFAFKLSLFSLIYTFSNMSALRAMGAFLPADDSKTQNVTIKPKIKFKFNITSYDHGHLYAVHCKPSIPQHCWYNIHITQCN